MIDLKTFKENAAKYFHLCMIEVQPQDVIEICERAIAAEGLAEARQKGAQIVVDEFIATCKEIILLKQKLARIENPEAVHLSAEKPTSEECPVWDLSQSAWEGVQQAAKESKWIPPEYYANDWHSDVQKFLREGISAFNPQPKLTVWYGSMPESNGKSNWTAILHRADSELAYDGHTIDRSEYPDRVRYEADRVRYLIGELGEMPDILAYDADKHSDYVEPTQLKSIIQDTVEHGTGFAITDTNGIQHVKQEDVLTKPFAEIDYWQGNKLYCTILEHVENLDIGDKLYLAQVAKPTDLTPTQVFTKMCPQPIHLDNTQNTAQVKMNWADVTMPTTADTVAAGIQVKESMQQSPVVAVLNSTEQAHTLALEIDRLHVSNDERGIEIRQLKARIAELEQPDSATPNPIGYVQQFVMEKGLDGYTATLNPVQENRYTVPVYLQPPTKLQRITEQDAREIIVEFYEWNLPRNDSGLLDDWIKSSGSLLLAKLNEHREPDYKAQMDLLIDYMKNIEGFPTIYATDTLTLERIKEMARTAIAQCEGK